MMVILKNRKIVVAEALLESVIKECQYKDYKEIKKFKGRDFKDTICNHPFLDLVMNMIFQCLKQDL